MPPDWIYDAAFYHIYPMGLCDAPARNDFTSPPVPRLDRLYPWIDHIAGLNLNAVYFSPVFESTAHGYDTADYTHVDRRLGDDAAFAALTHAMKARGLRVVLDGVFNHVGRDFWAFRDLREKGRDSAYAGWFHNLDFSRRSPAGDPFGYEGWAGHYDLVKLNLSHPGVRQHLFDAVSMWIDRFDIDGLRLDAADVMDADFLRALAAHCRGIRPDFWLMGEVVHGDYRQWANPGMLDSTTNYECYKGLYSSLVDKNYFEIAYSLDQQFGPGGMYRDLMLYSFADNHDVDRVASSLGEARHLYPLYALLFTMPGVPSVYYGSEWGITGQRGANGDGALRPALDLGEAVRGAPQPDLPDAVRRLAALRRDLPALQRGDYRQMHVAAEQIAFARSASGQRAVVIVNAADQPAEVPVELGVGRRYEDRLNGGEVVGAGGRPTGVMVPAGWARVLVG